MDLATGVGLLGVVFTLIMIDGGNLAAYFDKHAVIVIFGGAVTATTIRFPFSTMVHGLPIGLRFASVTGEADTEPIFPDNPYLAANRRVTVMLMSEAPPTPAVKGLP